VGYLKLRGLGGRPFSRGNAVQKPVPKEEGGTEEKRVFSEV
jgi:hypothetical protein